MTLRPNIRATALGLLTLAVACTGAPSVLAAEPSPIETSSGPLRIEQGGYRHVFAAAGVGRGLRLNNPYRLRTPLGDDAESLSLTATYFDLGLGASFGNPRGWRHGMVAHLSVALEGVPQEVASLSYLLSTAVGRDFIGMVRAGVPVVLEPDLGAGLEAGVGGAFLFSGGFGLTAELVTSIFFGAATWESDPTFIPVISFQLGAYAEYEVLP